MMVVLAAKYRRYRKNCIQYNDVTGRIVFSITSLYIVTRDYTISIFILMLIAQKYQKKLMKLCRSEEMEDYCFRVTR